MMQYPPQPGQPNPPNPAPYAPMGPNQPRVAPPMGGAPQPMAPPVGPMAPAPGPVGPGPVGQRPMGPGGQRGIVRRNQNAGGGYWGLRTSRIWRNILDGPGRSLGIMVSCAAGIALAIAVIGVANGLQTAINNILAPSNGVSPSQFGIDVSTIQSVLSATQGLLTKLSIGFTAAIVGLVTWISTGQRRRSISLQVQQGQRRNDLIIELLGESLLLCLAGGLAGIVLGYILCGILGFFITSFTVTPDGGSIFAIFPATTVLAFLVTGVIVAYFATHTDTRASLS